MCVKVLTLLGNVHSQQILSNLLLMGSVHEPTPVLMGSVNNQHLELSQ